MFKKVEPRINFPEMEENILKFWDKNKIFEKSVSSRPKSKPFSFYDGPPFATGLPHYGHLLAGTIKDVIPRYKTMQGYRVERIWGWDTHGLPIENIVEQELDFRTKAQIEEYGIDKFNEKCRSKVLAYADEWKKIVGRTGRWVDMENAYLTMDPQFMESVWWVFKSLFDKGLIYDGHKVMPYCPRCATPLSNFELGEGYKDKNDKAATVKFELSDEPGTYLLAWTTTPWTLPGNLALSVGAEIQYVKVEKNGKFYILAKERLGDYEKELGNKITAKFKGKTLVGKSYKPVMNFYKNPQKAFLVIAGSHVTTEDGTGIVHTAPAFGEEDYKVAKENGIDFFMPVDDQGQFTIEVPDYAGASVVKAGTNQKILDDLGNKILKVEEVTHSYPHCWRCQTPLIYRGVSSWFVNVQKIKKQANKLNKKIYWMPGPIGSGRFAKMIESAPDWSISRNRFWGTPLPVWKCTDCQKTTVVGSISELEKLSSKKVKDLHLHKVQDINLKCECGSKMKLTGEVLDCWFESGSMPYASIHYPFENAEKFKRDFPADFIAEGVDQTRGWFRSLLMLSTALYDETAFRNVIVNGIVLAESGQKMSKSLNNYPDPMEIVHKYGADSLRLYLMSAPVVRGEDWNFSEKGVDETIKKVTNTLWSSYSFFMMYASLDNFKPAGKLDSKNILDKWMVSKTNRLVADVTIALETYDLATAGRALIEFMDELSNWYIRRSRKRFWKSENDKDKNAAYETLHWTLLTYTKLLAPFMPFITEEIYQGLTGKTDSVHLASWPEANKKAISAKTEKLMELARKVVEMGLAERNQKGIKVRQPLAKLTVTSPIKSMPTDLKNIIAEEVNIKTLMLLQGRGLKVKLDTKITPDLKAEGIARDLVRSIQEARKKAGFNVEDRIETFWDTNDSEIARAIETQAKYIAKETLSIVFSPRAESRGAKTEYSETVKLNGKEVTVGISRVK
jgi:isoleucyl-tRNA synthetase